MADKGYMNLISNKMAGQGISLLPNTTVGIREMYLSKISALNAKGLPKPGKCSFFA